MKDKFNFLGETRFTPQSKEHFRVPVDKLPTRKMRVGRDRVIEVIDFEDEITLSVIKGFIEDHRQFHLPRLEELERYYNADNNIKYKPKREGSRADSRVASDFAAYIVTFKTAITLGNPIEYRGEDDVLLELIREFNIENNEPYHNKMMMRDMLRYGRAYELSSVRPGMRITVNKLSPLDTFVVYDTTVNSNSLCAVRYFEETFLDKTTLKVEVYANDGMIYHFESEQNQLTDIELVDIERHYFKGVPITEWMNGEEGLSDYEKQLDRIDAYDVSVSEITNYMQDMAEALLVIKGNPDSFTDEDGNLDQDQLDYQQKNRLLVLGDKKIYDDGMDGHIEGSDPDAYYLTKSYDYQGTEQHNQRLVSDLLRFTHMVDLTDDNMGRSQTGIGLRFKFSGSDNDRVDKEVAIEKAIMRRLRLNSDIWGLKTDLTTLKAKVKNFISYDETDPTKEMYDRVNQINLKFNPNKPKSDVELMQVIQGLAGEVSEQTIFELAKEITGVEAQDEAKRLEEEEERALQGSLEEMRQRFDDPPEDLEEEEDEPEET